MSDNEMELTNCPGLYLCQTSYKKIFILTRIKNFLKNFKINSEPLSLQDYPVSSKSSRVKCQNSCYFNFDFGKIKV